MKKSE